MHMAMDQRKPGENEAHRLEDMDQRLYRRDLADRKEPRFDSLSPRRASGKAGWMPITDEHKEKVAKVASHPTFFKRFFVFALGFAALAVLIVFITFFTGGNTVSNSNIEIRVLGNSFTAGGDELPLQIDIVNKNATPLELADLFVDAAAVGSDVHHRSALRAQSLQVGTLVLVALAGDHFG